MLSYTYRSLCLKQLVTVATISCVGTFIAYAPQKVEAQVPRSIQEVQESVERLRLEAEEIRLQREIQERQLIESAERAERQQQIREAEPEAEEPSFPEFGGSPPQGTISATNGVQVEGTFLAYQAMRKVAEEIRDELITYAQKKDGGKGIALVILEGANSNQSSALIDRLSETRFSDRFDQLKGQYENKGIFRKKSVAAAIGFLSTVVPLFRTDRAFTGRSFTIANQAFVAQIAESFREINSPAVSVYYPAGYSFTTNDRALRSVLDDISFIQNLRDQAADEIASLAANDPRRTELMALNKMAQEEFLDGFGGSQFPAVAPFDSIVRGRATKFIEEEDKVLYYVSVGVDAGSTNRTSRNFLFSRLRHSGGAIVRYIVYSSETGEVVLSGTPGDYTGFTKFPTTESEDPD